MAKPTIDGMWSIIRCGLDFMLSRSLLLAHAPPNALFVGPDPFFYTRRGQLALQAARHAIPASYAIRDYVKPAG